MKLGGTRTWAGVLLVVALAQMAGDVAGVPALKGLAAATAASPAPKVFSSVRGLETYSTRFFLELEDAAGEVERRELTPEVAARLRGPYNRRNVWGAALAYGPVFRNDPRLSPVLESLLRHGFQGDAPLARELGIDPTTLRRLTLVYEPLPGTDLDPLPDRIEVPLR